MTFCNFTSIYHNILCEDFFNNREFKDFISKYLSLPILTRLKNIGLLCGTDWTKLYSNKFFYSRYDHSVGTALIAWNFSHDKKQCLASLFHDVSTPAFSHVSDFRKGDALKQESTESLNAKMILEDSKLAECLKKDGISAEEISDYHVYPICDNEIPRLSSDRLEYMFPSGIAFQNMLENTTWTLESAEKTYKDITVLKNEDGKQELGFRSKEIAEDYCIKFNDIGIMLQKNENKLALNMLGKILNLSVEKNILDEKDFYELSEANIIEKFEKFSEKYPEEKFSRLFRTFRNMKSIIHTNEEKYMADKNFYTISLNVKKRHINPLVKTKDGCKRITEISEKAKKSVDYFLNFKDTKFGAVEIQDC